MMSHGSRELKLGHTAEVNGHCVAHNIELARHGEPLATYPYGATGAEWTPKIYCLSLGKYSGSLAFNSLVVNGPLAATMKWLLQWTKVASIAGSPIGSLFWYVADVSSSVLSSEMDGMWLVFESWNST